MQRDALHPLHLHLVVSRSLTKIGDDCDEVQHDAVQMEMEGEACTCNFKYMQLEHCILKVSYCAHTLLPFGITDLLELRPSSGIPK
jgi:hypothetical protein